jgi:uncharacterized protein (UPF0332 family)
MAELGELLARGSIRRVPADGAEAAALLAAARRHLEAARRILDVDRAGAYVLAYDAARKAVTAHLAAQGLAVASRPGAHAAVADYAMTLGQPRTFRALDRMRRNRNRSEYGTREFSVSEVDRDLAKAEAMVDAIEALLDGG